MRASELRIGNWVIDNNKSVQVVATDFSYCEVFKPIPLTEEWLLNFNFEKSTVFGNFKVKARDYYHSIKYYDGEWIYSNDYSDADCYCIASVKYVHQLQNLYHALTGEELTIKQQ
jgi:hypothetical protein